VSWVLGSELVQVSVFSTAFELRGADLLFSRRGNNSIIEVLWTFMCILKGFLDNCFEHFFLLFFCLRIKFPQLFALFQIFLLLTCSCRNAVFSHFYARKGLIQLILREGNPRSIISVSVAGSFIFDNEHQAGRRPLS
jgi:hypothetical protein